MGRGDNFGGDEGVSFPAVTAETPAKKGTRSRPVKVRKYKQTTVFKEKLADALNKLHAEGQTIEFILPLSDIRGFEIVSYTEE